MYIYNLLGVEQFSHSFRIRLKYILQYRNHTSLDLIRTTKTVQTFSRCIPSHTLHHEFTHSFYSFISDSIDLPSLSICQHKHSLNSLSHTNYLNVFFHFYSCRIATSDALRYSSRRPSWIEASCRIKSAGRFLTIIGDNCRSLPNRKRRFARYLKKKTSD